MKWHRPSPSPPLWNPAPNSDWSSLFVGGDIWTSQPTTLERQKRRPGGNLLGEDIADWEEVRAKLLQRLATAAATRALQRCDDDGDDGHERDADGVPPAVCL